MSKVAQLKKKAADFELKKQFDKALAVYVDMLELYDQSPEEIDLALFNRVGDLLLKQGKVPDALNYYERAVDLYTDGGFHNNAIALCNKILRQSPGRTSIYYKLGKISAQKGFKSDAKRNYLEYADRMQKGGRIDEAFRALKEFADLCPDQEDIRLMLAEQLSRQSRGKEAVDQLQTLYERYEAEGRETEARATLDRMKAIDPAAQPRRNSGSVKQAAGDLVFLDLDEPIRGTPAASAPPAPPAPAAPPPQPPRAAAPPPAPEPEPEPLQLEPPSGFDAPLQDLPIVADDTGFELEASSQFESLPGLESNPFGDISGGAEIQPLEFEPTNFGDTPAQGMDATPPGLVDRSAELDFDTGTSETDGAGGDLDLIFPEAELEPEPAPPPPRPSRPAAAPSARDTTAARRATQDLPLISGDDDLELPAAPPPPQARPSRPTGKVAATTAMDLGDMDLAELPEPAPPPKPAPRMRPMAPPPGASKAPFKSVDVPAPRPVDQERIRKSREVPAFTDADILDLPQETPSLSADAVLVDVTPATIEAEHEVDVLARRVEADPENWELRREYAEALLESGARDPGLEELDRVMVGMERSDDLHAALDVADEVVRANPDSVRHHQKRVEYAFRLDDRSRLVEAYLALADALFRSGTPDKARAVYQRVLDLSPDDIRAQAALSTLASPTPAQSVPAQKDAKARPAASSEVRTARPLQTPTDPNGFVNLGDWLREDEGPRSTRMVVDEEEPSGDEEADFADMLKKFKQGVAQNVEDEDHQSHYDLGIAYKEMGLVDEAIAEFQKALRAPVGQRVPTYEALGQCFIEKEQFPIASAVLARALTEPDVSDEQLIGVLYLLGLASEGQGKMDKALEYYQRVFVVDIQFRDVAQRIMEAEQAARR